MTLIRCRACRDWFPKKNHTACPRCGTERHPHNEGLVSQAWRSNLNWHAEHADKHT